MLNKSFDSGFFNEESTMGSKITTRADEVEKCRLGNPEGFLHHEMKGMVSGAKANATQFSESLRGYIEGLIDEDIVSALGIANQLNQSGILTAGGGDWHESTVSNLLKRLGLR